jgi:hypothetical protein
MQYQPLCFVFFIGASMGGELGISELLVKCQWQDNESDYAVVVERYGQKRS